MMLLSLAIPNIIGMIFISGKVRKMVIEYVHDYQTGKFKTFK
jgi:Na+/alanine symporter